MSRARPFCVHFCKQAKVNQIEIVQICSTSLTLTIEIGHPAHIYTDSHKHPHTQVYAPESLASCNSEKNGIKKNVQCPWRERSLFSFSDFCSTFSQLTSITNNVTDKKNYSYRQKSSSSKFDLHHVLSLSFLGGTIVYVHMFGQPSLTVLVDGDNDLFSCSSFSFCAFYLSGNFAVQLCRGRSVLPTVR